MEMNTKGVITLAILLFFPALSLADDTEIYYAKASVDNEENDPKANVLFLIDTSGSMCRDIDGDGLSGGCSNSLSRMTALKDAFSAVIDGVNEKISVGVGKFNGGHDSYGYGGYVFYPVSEMTQERKSEVTELVNGLDGTSNTPVMEAYSEHARYMIGESPTDYAKIGEADEYEPRPAVNLYPVCEDWEWDNGGWECGDWGYASKDKYETPVNLNNQCESNHIIVMTDGEPTRDSDYDSVRDITGNTGWAGCSSSAGCQEELAGWLYNNGDSLATRKSIKTWQVALGGQAALSDMNEIAKAGGTEYARKADNAEELAQTFVDILNLIDEESRSTATPGVSVNRMNRYEHLDQLYYSVFQPDKSSYWEGNLKRYRLSGGNILDADGDAAIDNDTGYFSEDSKSFWSSEDDGYDVLLGGAREQLAERTLFYGSSGSLKKLDWGLIGQAPYTNEFFGLPADADEVELDRLAERLKMLWGDPLHSVPVLVNYGGGENDNVVFVSTNAGMLHAINTENGEEIFSFMPEEFIRQADKFTTNRLPLSQDNSRQLYGLDGSWVAWHRSNGQRLLFGGMRRGGKSYYALDVTNLDAPSVKWKITPDSTGFENLGQTWSTPILTQLPGTNGGRPVLVFGGGYSSQDHDNYKSRNAGGDSEGNALYIVDAETGTLVWSASSSGAKATVSEMKWAIPSSIAVVDINFDGLADHFYFADLGGQLFRVDIDQAGGNNHKVHLLATLAGTAENPRRFYEAPAVAYVEQQGQPNLYVAFSSGYRAHPLDEKTSEAFFVIRDNSAIAGEAPEKSYSLADIEDITGKDSIDAQEGGVNGWYYRYSVSGEKSLSSPLIYDSTIYFGTFAPVKEQDQDNPCAVRVGEAYLHVVDLLSGKRIKEPLEQDTPPPTPVVITEPDDDDCEAGSDCGDPPPTCEEGSDCEGDGDGDGTEQNVTIVIGTDLWNGGDPVDLSIRKRNWRELEPNDANFIDSSRGK